MLAKVALGCLVVLALHGCLFPDYVVRSDEVAGSAGSDISGSATGANAGTGATGGSAPSPATLLAYYKLDEGEGTLVADSSGQGNDGELGANEGQPLPSWTSGKFGGGLSFAGENFVRIPYTSLWNDINKAGAFTIAAFSLRHQHKPEWSVIVSRQYQTSAAEHFSLSWRDGKPASLAIAHICESPDQGPLDVWVHSAAVYDGSTLRLYQDGVQVGMVDAPGPMQQDDMISGVVIGGNANSASALINETFVGDLDDVVIYARALPVAEIQALASGQPPQP